MGSVHTGKVALPCDVVMFRSVVGRVAGCGYVGVCGHELVWLGHE